MARKYKGMGWYDNNGNFIAGLNTEGVMGHYWICNELHYKSIFKLTL